MKGNIATKERSIQKEAVLNNLSKGELSYLKKYQDVFIGNTRLNMLVEFELITFLLASMPGGTGYVLRKWFFPRLFRGVGAGVLWGRNITLRHPGKIQIGDRVAIDDNCLLDAKGAADEAIVIGNDVLIARDTIIQAKCSSVRIGDGCVIGSQSQLTSVGGIEIGKSVGIGGQCYIGGGRYRVGGKEIPIIDQEVYSKGHVIIEDHVSLGANVVVLDGVKIGKGCMVGSGAVVREDVPEHTVVTPYQKLVMLPRGPS